MHPNGKFQERKESMRRQRIEAEQRRRDELRDGYTNLKDVLPPSNQKGSKVSLLKEATTRIPKLEKDNQALRAQIARLEEKIRRLRTQGESVKYDKSLQVSRVNSCLFAKALDYKSGKLPKKFAVLIQQRLSLKGM
ncbi:hypothetical protein B0H13DRAFT_1586834 [Mycena leptocephala]|nr:hypothetical protein B0H13DRAFT_1586834 [Mycena leptocephala]